MLIYLMIFALILIFLMNRTSYTPRRYSQIKRAVLIGNLEIERCDIEYYNSINEEYNRRKSWYQPSRKSSEAEDLPIDIPEQYLFDEDRQNVHDTLIVNSCKNIYEKMNKSSVDDLYFLSQFGETHKNILVKIKERNSYVYNIKKGEWDAVKDIWVDSSSKPLVREQYLKDLEDCLDDKGDLYCATGVVNRLLSCVNILHPEKMPRTKDIFKIEIMNRFSILMKSNSKENSRSIIETEYKDILTEDKLKEIIDEWYEFI